MTALRISKEAILAVLKTILDPYLGVDLVTAKVLKNIIIKENLLLISLKFGYPICAQKAELEHTVRHAIQALMDDKKIELQIEIIWEINAHRVQKGLKAVPGIKNIIAIASGKGGVGKSTTAVNLALAMQAEGGRVGILDADIHGPSQALILGTDEKPSVGEDKRMRPVLRYGLQSMSMGYLVEAGSPMVWRGPMVSRALQQLLEETAWVNLDYLIVDMPPGTGDIALTLAQKIPVCGAVVVTTPQDIALLDAKKALVMFQKLGISVLGVIENMSIHICSKCGNKEAIFGFDGGRQMSIQYDVPLLGQLPLDIRIREQTDSGRPSVAADPNSDIAKMYREIARHLMAKLSLQPRDYSVALPTVVIEDT